MDLHRWSYEWDIWLLVAASYHGWTELRIYPHVAIWTRCYLASRDRE
jgi:hypothetical protein